MTRTESFVPRETHFRSPFEASRPHLRAQSHSFIFYQARASSCPLLSLFKPNSRARIPFLKGWNRSPSSPRTDFDIRFFFCAARQREKYPEITPLTSRGTGFRALSSRKQGRDPKGFHSSRILRRGTRADTPRGYHFLVSPDAPLPFVLSRKPRFWDFTLSGPLFDFFSPRHERNALRSYSEKLGRISWLRLSKYRVTLIDLRFEFIYTKFENRSPINRERIDELFPRSFFLKIRINIHRYNRIQFVGKLIFRSIYFREFNSKRDVIERFPVRKLKERLAARVV